MQLALFDRRMHREGPVGAMKEHLTVKGRTPSFSLRDQVVAGQEQLNGPLIPEHLYADQTRSNDGCVDAVLPTELTRVSHSSLSPAAPTKPQ